MRWEGHMSWISKNQVSIIMLLIRYQIKMFGLYSYCILIVICFPNDGWVGIILYIVQQIYTGFLWRHSTGYKRIALLYDIIVVFVQYTRQIILIIIYRIGGFRRNNIFCGRPPLLLWWCWYSAFLFQGLSITGGHHMFIQISLPRYKY